MFELQNKDFANQKFAIAGKTLTVDEKGRIEVESQDVAEILMKTGFTMTKGKIAKEEPKVEAPKVEAAAEVAEEKVEEPKEERKSGKKNRWQRSKE